MAGVLTPRKAVKIIAAFLVFLTALGIVATILSTPPDPRLSVVGWWKGPSDGHGGRSYMDLASFGHFRTNQQFLN